MQNFASRFHVTTFAFTLKNNIMPEKVKEHVKNRLAQVQDQLAIAIKYNDKVEIALYSYAERNLIKLNKLVNPELYK